MERVLSWGIFIAVSCTKGKTFCERPFTLHRQQPEKDKENFDVTPLEKFLRGIMVTALSPNNHAMYIVS